MKSVLISVKPKWCELIANGKKTVEVRKTKPKLDTPFKCYIYCTKPRHFYKISKHLLTSDESLFLVNDKVKMCDGFGVEYEDPNYKHLNCKVIGEFVCDKIDEIRVVDTELMRYITVNNKADMFVSKETCLSVDELYDYLWPKKGYGLHISDLVIYDKPKELIEFRKPCICGEESDISCFLCGYSGYRPDMHIDCFNNVTRPPQSWCYVESEVDNNAE